MPLTVGETAMRWLHRALERWPPQFPWLKTRTFLVSNISPHVLVAWWSPNQTFSQCGLQSLVTHSTEVGIRQTWAEVLALMCDSCGNSGPLTSGMEHTDMEICPHLQNGIISTFLLMLLHLILSVRWSWHGIIVFWSIAP